MAKLFESRIIGEYRRRDKSMRAVYQKARKLKDQNMISESEKFQLHYETLLEELESFYKKYRDSLVKFGIIPMPPLKIELTDTELDIIKDVQKKQGLRF
ncbi:MAG: hypothetical protein ACE5DT_00950 [Nitrosopumilus sp.]